MCMYAITQYMYKYVFIGSNKDRVVVHKREYKYIAAEILIYNWKS